MKIAPNWAFLLQMAHHFAYSAARESEVMTQAPEIPKGLGNPLLSASEYVAENAFVAPGFHRLFTATGLAGGLWSGRKLMDAITARRDGKEITRDETPLLLRPFYGRMRYNPYSDSSTDRWRFVADRMMPLTTGAVGAWAGSWMYGYGRDTKTRPFHIPTANTVANYEKGILSQQVVDSMARIEQANIIRYPASALFGLGSSSGTQVFGAFTPFSNGGLSAVTFQQLNERRINLFGLRGINRSVFANRSYGSATLRPAMVDAARWAEANLLTFGHPDHWMTEDALLRRARDGLQNFRHVTPEMEQNLMRGFRDLIQRAHSEMQSLRSAGKSEQEIAEGVHSMLTGERPLAAGENALQRFGFFGQPFDNMLVHYGIPLEKAEIGGSRAFSFLSRMLGSVNREQKIEAKWAAHLKQTYGLEYGASRIPLQHWKAATAWTGLALGVTGVLSVGILAGHRLNRETSRTHDAPPPQIEDSTTASHPHAADAAETMQRKRWINGRPLDVMYWLGRVAITPPSMHRWMNAAFLSAALFGGMKFANILTGRDLKLLNSKALPNSLIAKEDVWKSLQPLHGLLSYTPGSVAVADRWRQAAHYLIPVGFGALGTYTGSTMFFRHRTHAFAQPKTLEDYTDRILLEQSKPFGVLTAATSIFNTGSGLHLLPFINYSSNMHNRFLMGNGQQVAMPGLGRWWSGNPGLTPWGIKRTLDYMTEYLTYNPSQRPHELPSLVHSVIGKLYPRLDDNSIVAKKQVILNRIYEVRDSYLVDGTVPEAKKEALHNAMQQLVTGTGFECLLELAGLDPRQANLASNGVSGKVANALGSKRKVAALEEEYRANFEKRAKLSPADYLHALADRSSSYVERVHNAGKANDDAQSKSSANDNRPRTFTDRIKAAPHDPSRR